ncbi:MAG: hypothetical protein IJK64_09685 [Clostridia bacterium]|nr:hypothetical protein [Clostridia bacterium]
MEESKKIPPQARALAESSRPADAQALIDAFGLDAQQKQKLASVLGDPAQMQALLRSEQAKRLAQQMQQTAGE